MAHDFRLSPKIAALLGQIELVREVRSICREGGPLANELRDLMNHLRRELPGLVPGMAAWQIQQPYVHNGRYYLETSPGETWKHFESEIVFGLYIKCDPTFSVLEKDESPLDQDPCVYAHISVNWPNRDNLILRLKDSMPKGFTDFYPPGDPDKSTPIWRYLPLGDFVGEQGFNADSLIWEIVGSFQALMSLCPVIDQFTQGKRRTAAAK